MTTLVIAGQDIRELSVGLSKDGAIVETRTVVSSPETYLRDVAQALADWATTLDDLVAVAVVTGPGSFTSSRVSVMIANGIAFSKGIPVVGIPNVERVDFASLTIPTTFPPIDQFAVPIYDRPPHITSPNP
jgi:tRNA A37 threonylcarbamoyladenosine modification protein TsaB